MPLAMTKELIKLAKDEIVSIEYNTPENAMDTISLNNCQLIIYPHSSGPYSIEKWEDGKLKRKLSVILESESELLSCMTSSQFLEQSLKIKIPKQGVSISA